MIFIFIWVAKLAVAQSVSFHIGYPIYLNLMDNGLVNRFNCAVGVKGGVYGKHVRFDAGVMYSTKNYSYSFITGNGTSSSSDRRLYYITVPLTLQVKAFTDSVNTVSILAVGDILNAFGYSYTVTRNDGSVGWLDDVKVKYKTSGALRLGARYARRVGKRLQVFAECSAGYRLSPDSDMVFSDEPNVHELPEDRWNLLLNVGIEFILTKKKLKFYSKRVKKIPQQ